MNEPISDPDGPRVSLNLSVRGLSLSATVGNNERCDALIAGGRRIYKLVLGQSPFPVPNCLVRQLRENAHQKDYLPVRGLPQLREAVAQHPRPARGRRAGPRLPGAPLPRDAPGGAAGMRLARERLT